MEKDITLSKDYSDFELIKRSLSLIKEVKGKFILGLLLCFILVGMTVLLPFLAGYYIDLLDFHNLNVNTIYSIILFFVLYATSIIVMYIISYFGSVIIQKAGQEIIFKMRQNVYEKVLSLSQSQLNEIPVGKLVTRVTSDTNALNELYSTVIVSFIQYVLMIIAYLVSLIVISPTLTLYLLGFIVLIIVSTIIYRIQSKKAYSLERKEVSNMNTFLSENLNGIKVIQAFNQQSRKQNEFNEGNSRLVIASKKVVGVFALYRPVITLIYYLSLALVFLVGFTYVMNGTVIMGTLFTFGKLATYYQFVDYFFGPVQNLSEIFDKFQAGLVSSRRIFNILDMVPTVKDEGTKELDHVKGKIEFRHVTFYYEEGINILDDVSFVINPHTTVAFCGLTGAGKSTILSLLVRNYDIQQGEILLDDINIKDIPIDTLRKKIGQMMQDVTLFSGSIKDNITLKDDSYSEDDIKEVCKYVNADTFIDKLDNGLNTLVSENGSNFSVGQKQLLSFARTILRKPEILTLDEATANIDTETEALIQDSLKKIQSLGTMIVIAHRLSTIQHADQIIFLRKGKIVERGTHQELLNLKGYYYKLYTLQNFK